MAVNKRVIPGLYRDSVTLMKSASRVEAMPGVEKAGAMMATVANLDLARDAGMLGPSETVEAGPNDLLLLVESADATIAEAAFGEAERILSEIPVPTADGEVAGIAPRSIRMGLDAKPDASLVLISTPGEYAASEAFKAVNLGLDVMIFSDNVPVAEEVALKTYAAGQGALVMGPDCGTAVIDGVGLGFANAVRPGRIGLVAASGTGCQQLLALLDHAGGLYDGVGVRWALGVGLLAKEVPKLQRIFKEMVALVADWREKLFASMHRNAAGAADFLNLPTNRLVELGTKVEI